MFEIHLTWEIVEGVPVDLIVTGKQGRAIPAMRRGRPEDWREAEGGEIEIAEIKHDGAKLSPREVADLESDERFINRLADLL